METGAGQLRQLPRFILHLSDGEAMGDPRRYPKQRDWPHQWRCEQCRETDYGSDAGKGPTAPKRPAPECPRFGSQMIRVPVLFD